MLARTQVLWQPHPTRTPDDHLGGSIYSHKPMQSFFNKDFQRKIATVEDEVPFWLNHLGFRHMSEVIDYSTGRTHWQCIYPSNNPKDHDLAILLIGWKDDEAGDWYPVWRQFGGPEWSEQLIGEGIWYKPIGHYSGGNRITMEFSRHNYPGGPVTGEGLVFYNYDSTWTIRNIYVEWDMSEFYTSLGVSDLWLNFEYRNNTSGLERFASGLLSGGLGSRAFVNADCGLFQRFNPLNDFLDEFQDVYGGGNHYMQIDCRGGHSEALNPPTFTVIPFDSDFAA